LTGQRSDTRGAGFSAEALQGAGGVASPECGGECEAETLRGYRFSAFGVKRELVNKTVPGHTRLHTWRENKASRRAGSEDSPQDTADHSTCPGFFEQCAKLLRNSSLVASGEDNRLMASKQQDSINPDP